jgi:hypothetical protein
MSSAVAYNPSDPLQQAFLSALALGETGGASNSATLGVGGTDLSSIINSGQTDEYGFPIWNGTGNSHAAGTFQFQPSTWQSIAQQFHLNFANSNDQAEGAWYLAEQTDPNLYTDLQTGNYANIQAALKNVWPSVTGNGAAPQGLANDLATAVGVTSNAATNQTAANNAAIGSIPTVQGGFGAFVTQAVNAVTGNVMGGANSPGVQVASSGGFAQGALIVVGAVVIFVALWMLLSSTGAVPSPKQTLKGF